MNFLSYVFIWGLAFPALLMAIVYVWCFMLQLIRIIVDDIRFKKDYLEHKKRQEEYDGKIKEYYDQINRPHLKQDC